MKPRFCCICGRELGAVRHIMSNSYETLCEQDGCGIPCVVLTNDAQKLPQVTSAVRFVGTSNPEAGYRKLLDKPDF